MEYLHSLYIGNTCYHKIKTDVAHFFFFYYHDGNKTTFLFYVIFIAYVGLCYYHIPYIFHFSHLRYFCHYHKMVINDFTQDTLLPLFQKNDYHMLIKSFLKNYDKYHEMVIIHKKD